MDTFIIEHPRRGTFRELDESGYADGPKARFSATGARNDPDKTVMFSSLREAYATWEQIPTPLRYECNILIWNPKAVSYYKLVKTP